MVYGVNNNLDLNRYVNLAVSPKIESKETNKVKQVPVTYEIGELVLKSLNIVGKDYADRLVIRDLWSGKYGLLPFVKAQGVKLPHLDILNAVVDILVGDNGQDLYRPLSETLDLGIGQLNTDERDILKDLLNAYDEMECLRNLMRGNDPAVSRLEYHDFWLRESVKIENK